MDEQPGEAAPESAASTFAVEVVVAAVIAVVGLVIMFQSWKLGAGWTSDGPGAGYFPFYVSLIMTISGLGILVGALRRPDRSAFVDREQLGRVASVLGPAIVYVLAVQFVGLYVASSIYIAIFMVVLGKYAWLKSLLVAVIVNVVFFMMFEVWFKVPLFKGSLNPLGFLGY
jgi:Tripartite tricarboxylate transporter TctB family